MKYREPSHAVGEFCGFVVCSLLLLAMTPLLLYWRLRREKP